MTTSSTVSTLAQRSASAVLRHWPGVSGITRAQLVPASGKRVVQASSMVKGVSGASQAVRRANTSSITVRTARRFMLSGRSQ
ncbi:hypothetical protein D3C77_344960 [compost metagenome]